MGIVKKEVIILKTYRKPTIVVMNYTFEVAFAKKCHFADYQECSVSEQQFK